MSSYIFVSFPLLATVGIFPMEFDAPTHHPQILAFAPHPWDNHWLSRQQLLSRLAQRGWPVIYSHGPMHWWSRHTESWQRAPWLGRLETRESGVRVDRPGRWPCLWDRSSFWNQRVLAMHAARLLRSSQTPGTTVAMLFHPQFEPLLEWLRPDWVVYHVYDVYRLMDHWSPAKSAMEERLVTRADLITASSPGMARHLPAGGHLKARLLPNGADAHRFANADHAPCPQDLAAIPTPRIGYVGNINPKIDLDMVTMIAIRHPEWHWVFMGPIYMNGTQDRERLARQAWERLLHLPNIHFLGLKGRDEIPAYVVHMDVNVICYKIARIEQGAPDDWVVHGYPTKLHEYLATGRPVVAAPQEALREFADVMQIASDTDAWENALKQAIAGHGVGTPATRRARALENSWDRRVDQLENWLQTLIHPAAPPP
ncbi:MAG: glycosyltransferase family 1 protein [Magnetococcales bacterium]|nr:glycosyltransferase family 1 protein [Magnetococcales bacterium]